jgi:hypothetical protein
VFTIRAQRAADHSSLRGQYRYRFTIRHLAVSPDLCDEPVQTFQAFASDLECMADWRVAAGTKMVVMESTGVY